MSAEKVPGVTNWLCIQCGRNLGKILGGELHIDASVGDASRVRTRGPNLAVYCPDCGAQKTFFTSDPIVRALYQLVTAASEQMAKATIEILSKELNKKI